MTKTKLLWLLGVNALILFALAVGAFRFFGKTDPNIAKLAQICEDWQPRHEAGEPLDVDAILAEAPAFSALVVDTSEQVLTLTATETTTQNQLRMICRLSEG